MKNLGNGNVGKDRFKWVFTGVILLLVLALVVGLCFTFIPRRKKASATSFDVDWEAYNALKLEDVKDCVHIVSSAEGGNPDGLYLYVVSYDKHKDECVIVAGRLADDKNSSGEIDNDESGLVVFFRFFNVSEKEVQKATTLRGFVDLVCLKESSMLGLYCDDSGAPFWMSMVGTTASFLLVDSGDLPGYSDYKDIPSASLYFDTAGTFCASDKIMKILT